MTDTTVTVGEGELDHADLDVRAASAQVLPMAKLVYTPEMLKRAHSVRARGGAGGRSTPPAYLIELHDRLAVLTQ